MLLKISFENKAGKHSSLACSNAGCWLRQDKLFLHPYVYLCSGLSLSQFSVWSRAPDFQEKQQPSQKLLKPENTCSALWNLSSQTRIAGWEVPNLQQLGLVPMISFPCQLLHHVLYWLAYPGYNLASFSFSHKLQNFNPVSAVQVKRMKSREKKQQKETFWL